MTETHQTRSVRRIACRAEEQSPLHADVARDGRGEERRDDHEAERKRVRDVHLVRGCGSTGAERIHRAPDARRTEVADAQSEGGPPCRAVEAALDRRDRGRVALTKAGDLASRRAGDLRSDISETVGGREEVEARR